MALLNRQEQDLLEMLHVIETAPNGSAEIGQMKISIGNLSKDERKTWKKKLRDYSAQIEASQHKALMGDAPRPKKAFDDPADEIQQGYAKQSDVLADARRDLQETEEVAEGILMNLAKQREVIQHAQANADEIKEEINQSDTLLNKMGQWWRG